MAPAYIAEVYPGARMWTLGPTYHSSARPLRPHDGRQWPSRAGRPHPLILFTARRRSAADTAWPHGRALQPL